MVRMLMSLLPMAAAFQVMDTHHHVDFDGLKTSLQSLAANSAKAGKIDQGTIAAVNGFLSTIQDNLLVALEADRNHTQNLYDDAVADVNQCNTDRDTWFGSTWSTWNTNVTDKKDTHESCRTQEGVTFDNFTSVCYTMQVRVCNWNTCALPAGGFAGGDTDAVDVYVNCVADFFLAHRDHYYTERTNCEDATNIHHAQTATCDIEQGEFEDEHCERESKVQVKCNQYDTCRFGQETTYLLVKTQTEDLEEIFQAQFVALHHLLCYGNQILANSTDLTGCDSVASDCETGYTNCPQITYPVPADFIICDQPVLGVEGTPCDTVFTGEFYAIYDGTFTPVHDCSSCDDPDVSGGPWTGPRVTDPNVTPKL